jgi:hypothetical protein
MFNRGIFYFKQYCNNILPRAEAAAVLIIPLPFLPPTFHFLKVSIKPTTVNGLTHPDAAQ